MSRLPRRTLTVLAAATAAAGLAAAAAPAAQAGTITECTRAAVAAAVTAGGSHTFACDGRIVMSTQLVVSTTVSLDAVGRNVTFVGARPNQDTAFAASELSARVLQVTATGNLTLRGVDLEDGVIVTRSGASGRDGTAAAIGANGPSDATAGAAAPIARGGCALVEAGGRLVLRNLAVRRCQAATARTGDAGRASEGGRGKSGTNGVSGSYERPGDGTDGTPGGGGGNGAPAVDGVPGSPGEGGAIFSAGALDVADVRFEDNLLRGGRGGRGGLGGSAGSGGQGGHGGNPYGVGAVGGDGGNGGAPGAATPGGRGGQAGAARGGAVHAAGETSIVRAHFARNSAIGGAAGSGGQGGNGAGGGFGSPGRVQVIGGTPDPACRIVGDPNYYTACGKHGTTTGSAGADGGDDGAAGDALGGALFLAGVQAPPVGVVHEQNRVVAGDGLAEGCALPLSAFGCVHGGGGGASVTVGQCGDGVRFGLPACPTAPSGARGNAGAAGRAVDPDVGSDQGDGLSASIAYEGDDLPGFRFPLGEPVPAKVTVRVSSTAPGPVSGIAFEEGGILFENEAEHVSFTGATVPAPFTLAPGAERTFDVTIVGDSRGATALRTRVVGKDALDRTAEAGDREVVRVGEDVKVAVKAVPDELDLEVDEQTGRPVPKPVTITVELENVSGEDLTEVAVELRTRVVSLIARNPSAPYPLPMVALVGSDGAPDTPLSGNGPHTANVGALAAGAKKTLTFRARAADKASVEVRADATGQAAGPRTVVGSKRTGVEIGQPKLLALTADAPLHAGTLKGGQRWDYSGDVTNLSPDEDVTVFVRTTRRENVAEGQLSELTDPDPCGCGVARRLEPGESIPVFGSFVTSTSGGTRGFLKLEMAGRQHTYDSEGRPVEVPVPVSGMVIAPGADERTVSIDRTDPPNPAFDLTEAAWLMSDSAARTLGERVTGAWDSSAAAYAFAGSLDGAKLAAGLQQVTAYVREELPEEVAAAKQDMVRTLLAFDDQLDSGEALAIADEAFAKASIASVDAYNETTWQDASTKTGAILAAHGPDLALEAVLPAIAACKMVKLGKAAMLKRSARLAASRPGRILARGLKALKPGDEISSLLARKLWGVDGVIDSQLLNYAKEKGLIIAVRERSPGSIRRLSEGMLPKWEAVKAKNVSQLDVDWLGFDETHLDTAMLKQMPDESVLQDELRRRGAGEDLQAQVLERLRQRQKEWDGKDRLAMEAYERDGVIVKPSTEVGLNPTDNGIPADNVFVDVDYELLRAGTPGDRSGTRIEPTKDGLPAYQPRAHQNGEFRAMTGDMDPIAFLDENGQIPSIERRKEIYRDLAKMGFQHPESLTWDNPAGRAKYLFDFDLGNPEASALLVYHPNGTRRAGFFDSRKSRLDEPGGKGYFHIEGSDISFVVGGPTPGDVPLILGPQPDVPLFLTPGGSAGANLVSTPGTRLIRRNPNGTFSEWTAATGWQPYTLPGGQTLTTLPQSAVRSAVAAGETRIDIASQKALILKPGSQAWFKPGDVVVLDPGGPNEEFVTVQALGSIIAAAPLKKAHVVGELVGVVPQPTSASTSEPSQPAGTGPAAAAPALTGQARPAQAAGAPSRPASSAPAPVANRLARVRLAKRSFARRSGTTLSFTLDRAARVTVTLRRQATGRRKGKTCSRTAKKGRRCRLLVAAGRRSVAGRSGTTKVAFGRGLRRGTYVATLAAAASRPVTLRFTVG